MRLFLAISALCLVSKAWAGGYAGAVERVMLYYAYQIDGLNSPAGRQLGFACVSYDKPNDKCRNKHWKEYHCTALDDPNKSGGKRCNFWEFLTELGDTSGSKNDAKLIIPQGTDINARTLPIEKTAVRFYMYRRTQPNDKVGDYFGYRMLNNGNKDYADFLNSVGDIVKNTAKSKMNDSNKWLFTEFENAVKQVKAARIGDNGHHLVDAFKQDKSMQKTWLVTNNPGVNPATKSEYNNLDWYVNHKNTWTDIDWARTQYNMEQKGIKNAGGKLNDFRDRYLGQPTSEAMKHHNVINVFKSLKSKVNGCK